LKTEVFELGQTSEVVVMNVNITGHVVVWSCLTGIVRKMCEAASLGKKAFTDERKCSRMG